MLDVGCWMLQDHEDRQEGRRQDVITPPPPPPKPEPPPNPPTPPTPPPPNQRANKRFSWQTWRTSQSCAHVGRNVGHRSHPLTMIWKETRTRRGLRRPSEPKKKGKRTLINLSETFGGSGNPRAGGSYEIVCCHVQSVVPLLKSASDLHRFVRSQFNDAYTVAMPLPCSNETVLSLRSEILRISKTRCRHADGSLWYLAGLVHLQSIISLFVWHRVTGWREWREWRELWSAPEVLVCLVAIGS